MKYYEKDESMVSRKVVDELILVPTRQNVTELQCIYTLNELGGRIWELIDGSTTVETLISTITQEYAVDTKQAEFDIQEFLDQLEQIGAITSKVVNGVEEG